MNNNQSFFIDYFNKILAKCQFGSFEYIDKLIFALIILIFILSGFCSSDILGIVSLVIIFLTVLKLFISKGEYIEMNLFEKFIFICFLIVIVSLFGSYLFLLSLKGFLKTVTYMGFYMSVVQFYRKHLNLISPTLFVICGCAIFQGLLGLLQNLQGVEEISTWQDTSSINPEQVMTRVYGSLKPLNPNLFGGYLISVVPALVGCIYYLFSNKNYLYASILSGASFLTIFSLISSGCRGAYVAFAFMVICFVLFFGKIIFEKHNKLLKNIYFYSISLMFTICVSLAMLITSVRTRIFSIFVLRNDSSTAFRFNVYNSVIQMIKDNWLFGIGVGNKNFREIYGLYMRTGFDALSTYNVFTEIWVESGIFALAAFVMFLFYITKLSLKYILAESKYRIIVALSLISILSVMVHGFFDTIFFRPQVQFIFWTMAAFISAVLYCEDGKCCCDK